VGSQLRALLSGRHDAKRLFSFGFALSPWQTIPYKEYYPSVAKFEGDEFDPKKWKPQTPTTAYMEAREDDAFWAARRIAAFSDELIRAAVKAGQFSDPKAEKYLGDVLIKRRDKILALYLTAINPIVNPRLDASGLTFENAAIAAGVAKGQPTYRASWMLFDNTRARRSRSRRPTARRRRWPLRRDCQRRPAATSSGYLGGPRARSRLEAADQDPLPRTAPGLAAGWTRAVAGNGPAAQTLQGES
jgi:hypothetical protein